MKYYSLRLLGLCLAFLILSACKVTSKSSTTDKAILATTTEKVNSLFLKGAYFEGANGIFFDDKDQLYVASVVGRKIGVVNTETGKIIQKFGPEEGIEGPDDLTIGPEGSLYFTSILTGEVGVRKPSGEVTKQMVAPGVNPITISDDGRLFVALDFLGDGLYELDPALKNPPRLILKELGWLNGMDFGPDGLLYGPIWSKGQIVKIDVDKAELTVVVDDLNNPAAVKFDSKGNIFTVDHFTGIIWKIDPKTGVKTEIAKGFPGADNLAFNSKDELFLSSAQDGGIFQVFMDGTHRVVQKNSFCNAGDIAIVGNQLFVPDIFSLKSFDKNTGTPNLTQRHTIGVPGLIGPFTIDHANDQLIMTSWFGNEVQVWNAKENKQISLYRDFMVPVNAIFADDGMVVAELGMQPGQAKVSQQVGDKREVLMDAAKGLVAPAGLAAANGNIFVSDVYTGVVYQITEKGEILNVPKVIIKDLKQPEGIKIGPKGNLLIVETGANQVLSVDLNNGKKSILVENIALGLPGIPNMPPAWKISDIDYDELGNLYVPSDIENVIYKIEKAF